jgi:hypothetical protein
VPNNPESDDSKKQKESGTDTFDWIHLYSEYDLDASLRDDPIRYVKRQMFLEMVHKHSQAKDTRIVVLVTIFVAVFPAFSPLPSFDKEGSYYFLSTVFQGFSAMLGLLAVDLSKVDPFVKTNIGPR